MAAMPPHILTPAKHSVRVVAYLVLAFSFCVLVLFFANLHSRLRYGGADYSFLGYLAVYGSLVGFGLVRFRRWAWLLMAIPLSLGGIVLCVLSFRADPSFRVAVLGVGWAVIMSAPAYYTAHFWKTLR